MAAFNSSPWIGNRLVRPTEAQLTILADWERGLGDAGVARLWRNVHYFTQHLSIAAAINGATVVSLDNGARIPYKVVAVDLGCEAAAAATTAVVEREPAAGGGFASILEAPVDIQTPAGSYDQTADVTDGAEDILFGDKVRLSVTAGAGACTGAQALLHCFRL